MLDPAPSIRPSQSWCECSPLQVIHAIAPPQTVIHIGAGTGEGELHQWHTWGVPQALLLDADAARLVWAEQLAAANPGWQVCAAIVAEADDPVIYHYASNPAEDGLTPATMLLTLWPNLRATGQEQRTAQRLDTLLAQPGAPATAHGSTWLLVECLPALPILQGADRTLAHCLVIGVRALLQPVAGLTAGADLSSIASYLRGHGFKHVATVEGHQPAIGHALFVRDWQFALQQQRIDYSAHTHTATELQGSIAALQAQTDLLAKEKASLMAGNAQLIATATELGTQRDAETAAKAEAIAQLDRLRQQRVKIIADYDQLARARDELSLERDAEAAAKAEALAQRHTETLAKAAAQTQCNALSLEKVQLIAAHNALAQQKADLLVQLTTCQQEHATLLQRVQQLEAVNSARTYRQQMQQEELVKAEAQIDLIKDLIFREPGL